MLLIHHMLCISSYIHISIQRPPATRSVFLYLRTNIFMWVALYTCAHHTASNRNHHRTAPGGLIYNYCVAGGSVEVVENLLILYTTAKQPLCEPATSGHRIGSNKMRQCRRIRPEIRHSTPQRRPTHS